MKYIPPARIYKCLQEDQQEQDKSMQTLITQILELYYNQRSNSKQLRGQQNETTPEIPSNAD